MTTEEHLEAAERQINRLADLLERLAEERHDNRQHWGFFPSTREHELKWCSDPLCRAASELANRDRL